MGINKIALVGASGNLGSKIRIALLDAGYELTILSRENSVSTDAIPVHPRQNIKKVNLDSVDSLAAALQGTEGVVSNVASVAIRSQKTLIDAAAIAGVERFIPSDFGMDMDIEANETVPFYQPKIEIANYLKDKVKAYPKLSYTFVCNGLFLEWSLKVGVLADVKNHTATLWDGGNTRVSTTTLPSVARAVVGVFNNLDATRDKKIHVHDAVITQRQIIKIVRGLDGEVWTTTQKSTAEAYQIGLNELKKPNPDIRFAVFNQLYRTLFSEDHRPCFEDQLDNDLVELPLMTDEQLKQVVVRCMAL